MINCIVVDDEPLARQLICSYIDQVTGMICVAVCQTAIEAFAALHQHPVDVIFIDIEMPGITGLNFIRSLKVHPKIVFITAFTEHAVEAFEIEATDYLVKPVIFERFLKAVQKIGLNDSALISKQERKEISSIFLKVDKRLVNVELASINYIEGLGDYLKVHTADQNYIISMTLGRMETLLPSVVFKRIHRSIIVNKNKIQFIEGNFVRIVNNDLPIGFTYRGNLIENLE